MQIGKCQGIFILGDAFAEGLLHVPERSHANWRGQYTALSARKFAATGRLERP